MEEIQLTKPVFSWSKPFKSYFSSSCCSKLRAEHETSTLCLKPILSRATISASPHVRPIALISFSTVLRQVAFGLPCFLFPWGVHLRAHHRTSLEDRSRGFFFLDTTKIWIHSDLFTAIFLIPPASRDFQRDCRMCDEI